MGVPSCAKERQIWGEKVVLVPYRPEHVEKYHHWMTDSKLQYLTGSEPLTLAEEYNMQTKWVHDDDKCTFIVLDRIMYTESSNEVSSMIGDTNIFFADPSDLSRGEIEIMIAEEGSRGTGNGKEVLSLMMRFAVDIIGVMKIEAKIKFDNEPSMRLFGKLGFKEISRSDVFQEITFLFNVKDKINLEQIKLDTNHIMYRTLDK